MSTVVSSFPLARDHIRADELIAATNSFFLERWPFVSQGQRDFFVRCNLPSFICKVIPDGEFEKMICACKANTLLFLTDDYFEQQKEDNSASELINRIVGIIRGEMGPRAGSPVEELTNRIFREIEVSAGVEQYKQLSRFTCETLRHQGAPVYRTMADYLAFRCLNVGGHLVLALARYTLDIYVRDDELQNPLLAECERLVIEVDAMEKEVQQNTLGNNLVALLQRGVDGHTFDSASAAKAYIREVIAEHEVKLHGAISVALNDKILGKSDAVCLWLQALPYIVSGNTWWSQHTERYNLPGKPAPRRVIHLEGVGDIIEPEP
ncbi:isoprenoid synthase domain-containing protein [Mycena olivaceomarginata]|nr:isoprenoid synthase domain-containing protein [Mycena olivaceomarginata]